MYTAEVCFVLGQLHEFAGKPLLPLVQRIHEGQSFVAVAHLVLKCE